MRRPLFVLAAEDHARLRHALWLITALTFLLFMLLWIAAASAQAVASAPVVPALSPDATALLVHFGLGQYAAGIASLVFVGGFVVTHLMPWLPPPSGARGFGATLYAAFYAGLNFVAGNYGRALNAPPAKPAA